MPQMKLSLLAMGLCILPLTACQTPSKASPSDLKEAVAVVNDTRADVKREFCRGQTPQLVDPEDYNALPDWAKSYITNNSAQWLAAGCTRET